MSFAVKRTLATYTLLGLSVFAVLAAGLLFVRQVEATHAGTTQLGGRYLKHGYFSNSSTSATLTNDTDVIQGGLSDTSAMQNTNQLTRKNEFIRQIKNKLSSSSSRDRLGAAFVIQTMRGSPWSRDRTPTSAEIADWEARILNPSVSMGRVGSYTYRYNSGYFSGINDDAFLRWDDTRFSLTFSVSGTVRYAVKFDCVNPVGSIQGLPDPTSPSTIQAQSLVNGVPGPVSVSASSGNVQFLHRIRVAAYNGRSHTVSYRIEREISTSGVCNGANLQIIKTDSVVVGSSEYYNVWGTATVTGWDRNTTLRICQRLVITNAGGASISGSSYAQAYANILDGTITVGTSSGGYLEPGAPFDLSTFVNANPDAGVSYSMTYNLYYTTNIPGLSPPGANSGTVTVSSATNRSNNWNGTIPINAPAGTQICMNVIISEPTQTRYFTGGVREIRNRCITVVYKPTVNVDGGDVSAGMAFESGGVCGTGSTTAAITGWPNEPAYNAAGTEFGGFALGRITGFATAQVGSGASSAPRGLAFANTPAGSGEDYGGSFGSLPCIADHYGSSPSPVSSLPNISAPNLQNNTDGHFSFSPAIVAPGISTITIPVGSQKVVYVDGDLRIGSNIVYAGRGSWSNLADIPGIKFVVRGNIYVRHDVTRLDGIYVAQPNPSVSGSGAIYTCVDNSWNPIARGTNASSNLYSTCNAPLTVNGTFSANRIEFLRTNGTAARGEVAEQFNYLPELWQTRWPADSSASDNVYDAITGLPPVL